MCSLTHYLIRLSLETPGYELAWSDTADWLSAPCLICPHTDYFSIRPQILMTTSYIYKQCFLKVYNILTDWVCMRYTVDFACGLCLLSKHFDTLHMFNSCGYVLRCPLANWLERKVITGLTTTDRKDVISKPRVLIFNYNGLHSSTGKTFNKILQPNKIRWCQVHTVGFIFFSEVLETVEVGALCSPVTFS